MKRPSLALLALWLLLSRHALAQTPEDVARSKELFRAGASAYAAGDYSAAIQALESAYELTPLPAIAFSLAQAERKQYLTAGGTTHRERAIALFRRYLDEAPSGNRRGDAHDALAQLEPSRPSPQASEAKAAVVARPTRLMIIVDAPNARISLDGDAGAASPLIREVAPGTHRVRATAPGFVTLERDATAVVGELILSELRLIEQPIPLVVYSPSNADVYVDGSFAGESEGRLRLELPAGEHQIAVGAKGHRIAYQRIRLVRGQGLSVRISPELSTQRIVSLSLLCAGGAALGAGVVLSALAVQSENRAEAFLGAQAHHPVSSPALIAYQGSVSNRDRYRAAAALSFAGAAGLFITGLFLHELDRPTIHDGPKSAPPRAARTAREPVASAFGFVPLAPGGGAGATLVFQF